MTLADYAAGLDRAYQLSSPTDVIFAVKQEIANQVRALDSRARIRTTDFFAHSFAPDIVIRWERQGLKRPLYIRQDVGDSQLADDLHLMQRERPIIFGLEPASLRQERLQQTEPEIRSSSTLVTDAGGVSEIVERRSSNRVVDIAAPALLQGGRGVLDEQTATEVATGLARGFVAAGNLGTEETRDAVNLIDFTFQPAAADRMIEFLRAVWIGAGGTTMGFPGGSHLQAGLTDEALKFLLEFEQNTELEFWRRVGSAVTLERLLQLELSPSRNLDALITANLDRITAKACGVQEAIPALDTTESQRGWMQLGESLAWQGEILTFRLAESKDSAHTGDFETRGLALGELLARAKVIGAPFESVELLTAPRKIEYGLSDNVVGQDVTNDPELRSMAASLGDAGTVRRAVASIPDAAALVLDFAANVASGRTAARFSIRDLITYALPLLASPQESDLDNLRLTVRENRNLTEPPGLF